MTGSLSLTRDEHCLPFCVSFAHLGGVWCQHADKPQCIYQPVAMDAASPGCIHGNRLVSVLVAVMSAALTEEGRVDYFEMTWSDLVK